MIKRAELLAPKATATRYIPQSFIASPSATKGKFSQSSQPQMKCTLTKFSMLSCYDEGDVANFEGQGMCTVYLVFVLGKSFVIILQMI